ncbi:hypothetical protein Mapa_002264 [Marchantia paleacea]|nr:hypothetical protein Mapa_002264 [Marchantia paleacea]
MSVPIVALDWRILDKVFARTGHGWLASVLSVIAELVQDSSVDSGMNDKRFSDRVSNRDTNESFSDFRSKLDVKAKLLSTQLYCCFASVACSTYITAFTRSFIVVQLGNCWLLILLLILIHSACISYPVSWWSLVAIVKI